MVVTAQSFKLDGRKVCDFDRLWRGDQCSIGPDFEELWVTRFWAQQKLIILWSAFDFQRTAAHGGRRDRDRRATGQRCAAACNIVAAAAATSIGGDLVGEIPD